MIAEIRAWAERHTAERRYSPVGITFHWTMAAIILFQLAWGFWIGRMAVGPDKLAGYRLHAEVGLTILVLAGLRFTWRLIVPGPVNDADRLGIQTRLAELTHIAFYICFFALPVSGWAMWSALGEEAPLRLAGLIPWPQMPFAELAPAVQWRILDWAEDVHLALVLLLLFLTPAHILAALKHHFWDRHDVLEGMLPVLAEDERRPGEKRKRKRRGFLMGSAGG